MQSLLGAVVLAAVLLIVVGRGLRGRRALVCAGTAVLVLVAAAALWWFVLFVGIVRLDPLLPAERHSIRARLLFSLLLWGPPAAAAALTAVLLGRTRRLQ
jgi:hypothetical protein